MSFRAVALALLLVSSPFAWPQEAAAGKAKSPFWAVLNANGTLERGNGAVSSYRYKTGWYVIKFEFPDLGNCAWVATTSDGYAGGTGVQLLGGSEIEVYTINTSTGALVDLPFHVMAACPKK
jgi:hypothetical protein